MTYIDELAQAKITTPHSMSTFYLPSTIRNPMQDYKPSSCLQAKRPRLDLSPGHGVSDRSGPSVPEPVAQPPPASEDRLVAPLPI